MDWNRDLTLDEALADPMIAAALRADRVDPRRFEAMLRGAARRIAPRRGALGAAPANVSAAVPAAFPAEGQLRSCRRPAALPNADGCRTW